MALADLLQPLLATGTKAVSAFDEARTHRAERGAEDLLRRRAIEQQEQESRLRARLQGLQEQKLQRDLNAPEYFNPIIGPSGEVQLIDKRNPQHVTRVEGVRARLPKQGGSGSTTTGAKAAQTSETERKAAALLQYAQAAYDNIEAAQPSLAKKGLGKIPVIGNVLQGMTDDEFEAGQQSVEQAARQFAEAWLRYTSGAAISEPELRRITSTIVPEPGDTEATLAQKKRARETILSAMKTAAGRALPQANPNAGGLTDAQRARAAHDPEYREFLEAQGKL